MNLEEQRKLKNRYILSKIYDNIPKIKKLVIFKYNIRLQNRLNLSDKDYKEYSETYSSIEIEIIPTKGKYGRFMYIKENDKLYYHIYFNDDKEEIEILISQFSEITKGPQKEQYLEKLNIQKIMMKKIL